MLDVYLAIFLPVLFWPIVAIFVRALWSNKHLYKRIYLQAREIADGIATKKDFTEYLIWASIVILGLYVFIVVLKVSNLGMIFENRNIAEEDVNLATYLNNVTQPALLMITFLMLTLTWRTSKNELQKSRDLIEHQLLIGDRPFKQAIFETKLKRLQVALNEPMTRQIYNSSIGVFSPFYRKGTEVNGLWIPESLSKALGGRMQDKRPRFKKADIEAVVKKPTVLEFFSILEVKHPYGDESDFELSSDESVNRDLVRFYWKKLLLEIYEEYRYEILGNEQIVLEMLDDIYTDLSYENAEKDEIIKQSYRDLFIFSVPKESRRVLRNAYDKLYVPPK